MAGPIINAGNPHLSVGPWTGPGCCAKEDPMTLSRTEVTPGLVAELDSFGSLIQSLDAQAWATPTRCAAWSVADTAAHVIGSIADVVAGRLEGLGTPEVTAREVRERKGHT